MVGRALAFTPEAEREAREAFLWYWQRDERAGLRFEAALTAALDRAAEAPEQGPVLEAGVRRLLVEGFPYGVLYAVEAERVVVLAIMHLRRRPGYWRGRRG
ncbi:MAG TPA: type II toxin-antitoxin system RelE/ParE family toxin [Polyangiaceae bacterium]|nr:type II toxin-antitoxin system RelE/ParE family toxin [Polyangiaceae bacterium]